MSQRTLQLLHSLGYSAGRSSSSSSLSNNIIDLRSPSSATTPATAIATANDADDADDTFEFLTTLLAESTTTAIETFGAGSLCVGNVSDDPDIEDVAFILDLPADGPNTGMGEGDEVWKVLVGKLGLDTSNFTEPTITPTPFGNDHPPSPSSPASPATAAGAGALIKGSKLSNLFASLHKSHKITASTRDESVLLVAFVGERKGVIVGLLGLTETT